MNAKRLWKTKLLALASLAILALAGFVAIQAQSKSAEKAVLSGVLVNTNGLPLKGANVKAIDSKTGKSAAINTDASGAYILNLAAGMYAVQFSADAFKTVVIQNVAVTAGDLLKISPKMIAGSKDQILVVQWKSNADTSDLDASLSKAVPLSSRNYTAASNVASGVSSQLNNATALGINTQDVKVGSGSVNNYMTDGVSVATAAGNRADSPGIPNPDTIEFHRVQSWSYSAGPERNAGGQIIVTTKSGTDQYHGSMWEFIRNDDLNANDYFLKKSGFPEPVLKQNQFGFTAGGPLLRKRLYFFTSYQGTRQRNGIDATGFAPQIELPPLPSGTNGVRSKEQIGAALCPANHGGSYDYQTRFGGVQVACDGSNVNDVAYNILNLHKANGDYFIPSNDTGAYITYPMTLPAKFEEDQYILNTDYVISPKHKISEKYFNSRTTQFNNFTSGRMALPCTPTAIVISKNYGVLRLASTLSPSQSNELIVSGQRSLMTNTLQNPFTNTQAGILSNVAATDTLDQVGIFGAFNFGGNGTWDANFVNQYQLADRFAWNTPKHAWRFGVEGDRRQWNLHVIGQSVGSLVYQTMADFILGLPGCPASATTCSTSNPVVSGLGATNGTSYSNVYSSYGPGWTNGQVTGPNGVSHAYRFSDYSAYINDTYKILPRLTLTYGLRWDYYSLPSDSTGNSSSFWPSLANPWLVPGSGGSYLGYVVPSNYAGGSLPSGVFQNSRRSPIGKNAPLTNFAPRFAAAYNVHKSLLVGAAYGWFYDRPDSWTIDQVLQAMPPYASPVGGAGTSNFAASSAYPFASFDSTSSTFSQRARSLGWGSVSRKADITNGTTSALMLSSLAENFATPLTQKWSVEVQNMFPHNLMVSAGYYGGHSIHQVDSMREYNTPRLASAGAPLYGITTNTVANAALRVPYLGLAPAGLSVTETQGAAKYNAVQATVSERFRNGAHVTAIYRFSKTLMNYGTVGSAIGTPVTLGNTAMNSNNSLDARQQYGPAVLMGGGNAMQGMTAPQRLVLRYGWDLPWKFKGTTRIFLADWGVSGATIIQAGTPMTVTDTKGGTAYGGVNSSRAQFCTGKGPKDAMSSGSIHDRLSGWFNKSAFCDTPIIGDDGAATGWGNSGTGIVRGPSQNVTDLSITKHFTLPAKSKMDFRAEFYNVFNHPNFANPDSIRSDYSFGQITACSVNPRIIQFGLKLTH